MWRCRKVSEREAAWGTQLKALLHAAADGMMSCMQMSPALTPPRSQTLSLERENPFALPRALLEGGREGGCCASGAGGPRWQCCIAGGGCNRRAVNHPQAPWLSACQDGRPPTGSCTYEQAVYTEPQNFGDHKERESPSWGPGQAQHQLTPQHKAVCPLSFSPMQRGCPFLLPGTQLGTAQAGLRELSLPGEGACTLP